MPDCAVPWLLDNTRHSYYTGKVFSNHIERRKDYFLEGVQFPVCHYFIVSYKKRPPLFLNEILETHTDRHTSLFCMHRELFCFWRLFLDIKSNLNTIQINLSFVFGLQFIFRQSFVSVAVNVHCTDVKGKRFSGWIRSERGRFCPKRQSRLTFSLSIESVLTSMDERGNMRLAVNYYMALQMLFSISSNLSESCSKSWLIFWAVIFA